MNLPAEPISDTATRGDPEQTWLLRLYVAGSTPRCVAALTRLKEVCEAFFPGNHRIEVIDLLDHPELAERDEILAIPTLVRQSPLPIRKIIGDLSDIHNVLAGLQTPTSRPSKPS